MNRVRRLPENDEATRTLEHEGETGERVDPPHMQAFAKVDVLELLRIYVVCVYAHTVRSTCTAAAFGNTFFFSYG